MFPHRESRWTRTALAIFFCIIIAYAYFELRGMLFGPTLDIASDVTTSREQFVLVSGRAERIVSLSMNGKEITVTEDGAFSEPYLLAKGLNRIAFDAKDTYGHTSSQTVEIMYIPREIARAPSNALPDTVHSASSTQSIFSASSTKSSQGVRNTTTSNPVEGQ